MVKKLATQSLGWGFGLWAFGYALGFAFYPFLSPDILGWAIVPFGLAATLWVLLNWLEPQTLAHYVLIGVIWTAVAVVLDYFFVVKLLIPKDGYYKPDVYFYYAVLLAIPVLVGLWRTRANSKNG